MADSEQSTGEAALVPASSVLMPGTRLTYFFDDPERRDRVEEALYRGGELVVARTASGDSGGEWPDVATRGEILDAARPSPERLMTIVGGVERVHFSGSEADDEGWVAWRSVEEESVEMRASDVRAGDVLGLLERLADRGLEAAGEVRDDIAERSPSTVADVAGAVAFDEIDVHQELLEERDVLERLGRVEAQLDRLLDAMEAD